jgi:malonyl-CoA O-methyltransferase
MNKVLIRERFAKNLESYNENAKIQKRMAERLVELAKNRNPEKILEIGCGTGFVTKLINDRFEFKTYLALDIVEECETYIENINPNITFIPADIEEFIKSNNENFDLIISNASLQWVDDFENVIKALQTKLNPNGELVFSTFGNENFREIFHITGTTLDYFSNSRLQEMFPKADIYPEIHIMAFNTPKDVLKHLQLTGVNGLEQKSWTKKDLIKFENGYKNICTNRPTLTYNPVYIRIISPIG